MSGTTFQTVYGLADIEARDSLKTGQPEVERLVLNELRPTVRLIRLIRLMAAIMLFLLAILMLSVEEEPVSFAFIVVVATGLTASTLVDKTGLDERLLVTSSRLLSAVAVAFCLQTVLIVFTGGIESPFLVIYIALMMLVAVSIGRRRVFLLAYTFPAMAVLIFAIGYATGAFDGLRPSFLAHPVVYTVVSGGVILGVAMIGGNVVMSVRSALVRSIGAAAEARSRTFAMVVERNRELVELSGALAHELKNPMAAIQGLTTVVARKQPEGSRQAEQMGVVLAEVRRMGSILEEFLNFSRPSHKLSFETVTPSTLIDEVVTLHEVYATHRGISFYVTIDADPPISCDPRKINQVLVNLVQNALDATPDDGQISFGVRANDADALVFTVDDSGPGLSGELQGRLFTPGTTTKAAGSGLGLTIAQAITHQHGGTLTLTDGPSGGCRATLTLPLIAVPEAVDEEPAT